MGRWRSPSGCCDDRRSRDRGVRLRSQIRDPDGQADDRQRQVQPAQYDRGGGESAPALSALGACNLAARDQPEHDSQYATHPGKAHEPGEAREEREYGRSVGFWRLAPSPGRVLEGARALHAVSILRRSARHLSYARARMRFGLFPAALVMFVTAPAWAQGVANSPTTDRGVSDLSSAPEQAAAREHFERALTLYHAGKYHQAVEELQAALSSDPSGKDLVYNLALVQEKLGDLDGAIASLERFQSMEKDPAELERTAQTIERLKGARAELPAPGPRVATAPAAPCPLPRVRGRFDSWVLGTGGVAVASFLVGTVFGVRALTLDPRGETTGPNVSFASLRDRAQRAHTAAIIADVAFSTSLLAGAAAVTLYFGRYADSPQFQARLPTPAPRVTAAWLELHY
jgi:tetratricopeptide (TPR) repeat protein